MLCVYISFYSYSVQEMTFVLCSQRLITLSLLNNEWSTVLPQYAGINHLMQGRTKWMSVHHYSSSNMLTRRWTNDLTPIASGVSIQAHEWILTRSTLFFMQIVSKPPISVEKTRLWCRQTQHVWINMWRKRVANNWHRLVSPYCTCSSVRPPFMMTFLAMGYCDFTGPAMNWLVKTLISPFCVVCVHSGIVYQGLVLLPFQTVHFPPC